MREKKYTCMILDKGCGSKKTKSRTLTTPQTAKRIISVYLYGTHRRLRVVEGGHPSDGFAVDLHVTARLLAEANLWVHA